MKDQTLVKHVKTNKKHKQPAQLLSTSHHRDRSPFDTIIYSETMQSEGGTSGGGQR